LRAEREAAKAEREVARIERQEIWKKR